MRLKDVSARLLERLERMQELAAAGPPAREEMDRLIADTRADHDALPAEDPRLRRMTMLAIRELTEQRDRALGGP